MDEFMKIAIIEAQKGIQNRDGGPFGAVIVKDGVVIAKGHNRVISTHDPTAHAEVVVIREASALLKRFDLSDCELYTTCEPCPMCYSAAHWAKIKKLTFGATRQDAADIGFDDEFLYEVLANERIDDQMQQEQMGRESCLKVFKAYENDAERTAY
ncbi:MAG: nucleoside deaminase [Firmicutes bacterium HGW-Firmicutes-19]|jgi:guanine deaminase|nr:MAG: nucleoside deaminase [Firmicutes bacterium HGW-Firmicutes-19]